MSCTYTWCNKFNGPLLQKLQLANYQSQQGGNVRCNGHWILAKLSQWQDGRKPDKHVWDQECKPKNYKGMVVLKLQSHRQ